jgi:hypothetical protein
MSPLNGRRDASLFRNTYFPRTQFVVTGIGLALPFLAERPAGAVRTSGAL